MNIVAEEFLGKELWMRCFLRVLRVGSWGRGIEEKGFRYCLLEKLVRCFYFCLKKEVLVVWHRMGLLGCDGGLCIF